MYRSNYNVWDAEREYGDVNNSPDNPNEARVRKKFSRKTLYIALAVIVVVILAIIGLILGLVLGLKKNSNRKLNF